MSHLLTKEQLIAHLNHFRFLLSDFDYSSIDNIRFLNLEALYAYMDTVENNPFQKQHAALERELDFLQPYLPFVSSQRAEEFLEAINHLKDDQAILSLKKDYMKKIRLDFINFVKTITRDDQWFIVLATCEQIRREKEESLLEFC